MALFCEAGWLFLLRWIHFLAGITWIGLLYYFNFVQTPFFAETEAPVRSGATSRSSSRGRSGGSAGARWSPSSPAGSTSCTGGTERSASSASSDGWAILLGGLLGSLMWANVWFVISPQAEDRHPERARHRGGQAGQSRRRSRGRPRRSRLPHQHDAVHADALLHGRGEPSPATGHAALRPRVLDWRHRDHGPGRRSTRSRAPPARARPSRSPPYPAPSGRASSSRRSSTSGSRSCASRALAAARVTGTPGGAAGPSRRFRHWR